MTLTIISPDSSWHQLLLYTLSQVRKMAPAEAMEVNGDNSYLHHFIQTHREKVHFGGLIVSSL